MSKTVGDGIGKRHLNVQQQDAIVLPLDDAILHNHSSIHTNTKISASDLANVQKLLKTSASIQPQIALYQNKLELHKKSEKVVKNWGNTVYGQRKMRLEALKEKEIHAEIERDRLDREWAEIQSQERTKAIERAQTMIRLESPRYKTLHSQLLLSQVLYERDLQRQHKETRNLGQQEQNQQKDQEIPFIKSELQEAIAQEKSKLNRLAIAKEQKRQMNFKYDKEAQEKSFNFQYGVIENKRLSQELKSTQETLLKKKSEQKSKWKKELDDIIASKSCKQEQERLEMEELEKDNARFERRKNTISKKHKEYVQDQFKEKDSIYDLISNIAYEENKEKESHVEEFILKGVNAHINDATDRIEKESKIKEELKRDMLTVQELLVKKAKEKIVKEKLETLKYKKMFVEQDEAHIRAKERDLEAKKLAIMECKRLQHEQMTQNQIKAEKVKRKAHETYLQDKKLQENEDLEFKKYANDLIKEWKESGRDTTLISKSLKDKIPRESGKIVEGIKLDTFERLGFTVRWMPEPKYDSKK